MTQRFPSFSMRTTASEILRKWRLKKRNSMPRISKFTTKEAGWEKRLVGQALDQGEEFRLSFAAKSMRVTQDPFDGMNKTKIVDNQGDQQEYVLVKDLDG